MAKYSVLMLRISYAKHEIEVEADSQEEAQNKALDTAGNFEYNEYHAEYEVDAVLRKGE